MNLPLRKTHEKVFIFLTSTKMDPEATDLIWQLHEGIGKKKVLITLPKITRQYPQPWFTAISNTWTMELLPPENLKPC